MAKPKGFRTIKVNGATYHWCVGKRNLVIRRAEDEMGVVLPYTKLFDGRLHYKDGQEMDRKQYLPKIILPNEVRKLIIEYFGSETYNA